MVARSYLYDTFTGIQCIPGGGGKSGIKESCRHFQAELDIQVKGRFNIFSVKPVNLTAATTVGCCEYCAQQLTKAQH